MNLDDGAFVEMGNVEVKEMERTGVGHLDLSCGILRIVEMEGKVVIGRIWDGKG
jgi:hypothetical protein